MLQRWWQHSPTKAQNHIVTVLLQYGEMVIWHYHSLFLGLYGSKENRLRHIRRATRSFNTVLRRYSKAT